MEIGKIGSYMMNEIKSITTGGRIDESDFERKLQQAMDKGDEEALKKACADFEAMFLQMMYKQMKATIPESNLIPKSVGRDIYESMLDEKLVEQAAESGGVGLADVLYKQLSKQLKNRYKISG